MGFYNRPRSQWQDDICVTYRYSPTQIRIVCACHGSHMSPEEFVRHAGEENSTPDAAGAGLASIPSSNTAASAQS
ncbi:Ninja-family protein [Sesamum angolense]|uniref:Ninja-family protein n=1 Tax=Sesamum angolense TaxID=2727404 RepID=A0AAE2BNB6_9LAMI|nr:Ninja-family protein [Sesamum angolense]